MGEVTREDAIRFCNAAMRNWQYVSFDEDELEDLRVELQRRLTTAQAEIEALRARVAELEAGLSDAMERLAYSDGCEKEVFDMLAALSGSQT